MFVVVLAQQLNPFKSLGPAHFDRNTLIPTVWCVTIITFHQSNPNTSIISSLNGIFIFSILQTLLFIICFLWTSLCLCVVFLVQIMQCPKTKVKHNQIVTWIFSGICDQGSCEWWHVFVKSEYLFCDSVSLLVSCDVTDCMLMTIACIQGLNEGSMLIKLSFTK